MKNGGENKMDSGIEQQTLKFWNISKAYNGKSDQLMTTSEGIHRLGDLLDSLNPIRPLADRSKTLLSRIINGSSKDKGDRANG